MKEFPQSMIFIHNDLAAFLWVEDWDRQRLLGDTERLANAGTADSTNTSFAIVVSWVRSLGGGGEGVL
jgi:hypothetical protein